MMVRRAMRSTLGGLAAALIGAAATLLLPTPAAYAAACGSASSGVTVVVDFSAFGGGVSVHCAPGDPATGVAALKSAGFAITGVKRWGEAFICRINGLPGSADEPCIDTPPASAYWSYWHAPRGGTWSYSQLGALSYNPKPGWVEGWAFGSGGRPGIASPAKPKPPPAPPTTKPPASWGGSGSTGTGAASAPAATNHPSSGSAEPTSATVDTQTVTSSPAEPDAADPVSSDAQVDAAASGTPIGTLSGVTAIAVLSVAAGVIAWRRRRAGSAPDG
jgi:hypothetical protein